MAKKKAPIQRRILDIIEDVYTDRFIDLTEHQEVGEMSWEIDTAITAVKKLKSRVRNKDDKAKVEKVFATLENTKAKLNSVIARLEDELGTILWDVESVQFELQEWLDNNEEDY